LKPGDWTVLAAALVAIAIVVIALAFYFLKTTL